MTCPPSGRGIKRIEQQVRHDLHNFTSEGHNCSIRLKALVNNDPLPLSLGAIKVRYFAKHCIQFEFCRLVAIAVKLERMCSDATQALQLIFERGDVSPRLGACLERGQQDTPDWSLLLKDC